ncbi:helix-turn-helix domain-containing protein [Roseiconus nitratireducens]|uniref:Helix-turn-helix domain-containing protein n=1 Tax=Roseiconus nitratireducens TaxID=2605748 RepID=A0A5M6CUA1_9BACT|nr:helix-turn-helix domain-containing protein [Roseiconus nitratireducens]KAA5538824.1 helix-turn-helix domain-containing protein [Roseiconus nitratireducens]
MRYRLDRALRILNLLQSGRGYDPVGLTVELNVNRRTVYRDIALLREMGINIEFDSQQASYVIRGAGGSDAARINPSRLRDALGRAFSSDHQDSSVEAIIRQVAHFLAGTFDDPDLDLPAADEASEADSADPNSPAATPATQTTADSSAGETSVGTVAIDTPAATSRNQLADVSPEALAGHLTQQLMSLRTDGRDDWKTLHAQPKSSVSPQSWCDASDSLDMLRQAMLSGHVVETWKAPVNDRQSEAAAAHHLRLIEFTVTKAGVTVLGTDAEGRLVQAASDYVRVLSETFSEESVSVGPGVSE